MDKVFINYFGMECAKISAVVTGKMTGKGKQGGMDLTFNGDIEGIDLWYFAYKEGIFVKIESNAKTDATIVGSGPQDMTIPMKMNIQINTYLIK